MIDKVTNIIPSFSGCGSKHINIIKKIKNNTNVARVIVKMTKHL